MKKTLSILLVLTMVIISTNVAHANESNNTNKIKNQINSLEIDKNFKNKLLKSLKNNEIIKLKTTQTRSLGNDEKIGLDFSQATFTYFEPNKFSLYSYEGGDVTHGTGYAIFKNVKVYKESSTKYMAFYIDYTLINTDYDYINRSYNYYVNTFGTAHTITSKGITKRNEDANGPATAELYISSTGALGASSYGLEAYVGDNSLDTN